MPMRGARRLSALVEDACQQGQHGRSPTASAPRPAACQRDDGRSPGSRVTTAGPAFPNPPGPVARPRRGERASGSPLTVAGAAADLPPDQRSSQGARRSLFTRSRGTIDAQHSPARTPAGKPAAGSSGRHNASAWSAPRRSLVCMVGIDRTVRTRPHQWIISCVPYPAIPKKSFASLAVPTDRAHTYVFRMGRNGTAGAAIRPKGPSRGMTQARHR